MASLSCLNKIGHCSGGEQSINKANSNFNEVRVERADIEGSKSNVAYERLAVTGQLLY